MIDIGTIVDRYLLWNTHLPRVKPFYAAKCCYSSVLLETLAALGTGFDVANMFEIQLLNKIGVQSDRMIYANTIKQEDHLAHAR